MVPEAKHGRRDMRNWFVVGRWLDWNRATKAFFFLASAVLVITALAKLISSFAHTPLLLKSDLVTGLSYKTLFRVGAVLELAVVAGVCLVRSQLVRALILLSLFNVFLVYRLVPYVFKLPVCGCPCFGLIPRWVPFSPNAVTGFLDAYLLVGAMGSILIIWLNCRGKRAGASRIAG